jgi:hypothetical protein
VLRPGGSFIVVPSARFLRRGPLTALIESAYRITGQHAAQDQVEARVAALMRASGLGFESRRVDTPHARVTVWLCAYGANSGNRASMRSNSGVPMYS